MRGFYPYGMKDLFLTVLMLAAQLPAAYVANRLGAHYTQPRNVLINVKPFTCTECLTFWLTLILCALCAVVAPRVEYFTYALLISFINYFYSQSKIID